MIWLEVKNSALPFTEVTLATTLPAGSMSSTGAEAGVPVSFEI